MQKELRTFVASELRATGSRQNPKIEGYAAVFNSVANIGGQFNEVIRQGAFKRTLANGDDVVCLFNHDDNLLLGRLSAGTLILAEDSKGLKFSCELPDTTTARDVYANLKAGNLKECSFGFYVNGPEGERWTQQPDGKMLRELLDVVLFDVSAVVTPAYQGTSAAARKNIVAESVEKRLASLRGASDNVGAVPFTACSARSEDPYNSVDEANGIINWADGEDEDRADAAVKNKLKAAQGFLYVANDGGKRSDYRGAHHTIVDGQLAHSQIGTLRAAQAWANGKLDVPAEHRAAVKDHLDSEMSLWFGDGNSYDDDRQIQRLKLRRDNLFSN
jgi:HK97 family phage prohead protease